MADPIRSSILPFFWFCIVIFYGNFLLCKKISIYTFFNVSNLIYMALNLSWIYIIQKGYNARRFHMKREILLNIYLGLCTVWRVWLCDEVYFIVSVARCWYTSIIKLMIMECTLTSIHIYLHVFIPTTEVFLMYLWLTYLLVFFLGRFWWFGFFIKSLIIEVPISRLFAILPDRFHSHIFTMYTLH